ncbi:beta-ketoacyl synthase N-terminal-like domain-containing protein [Alkalilimnicola ehrlichii]|uniref:thiolase family protein n=1 Tax=Alkalilimnicola ehrlichii TaxID=351052 RepID=UPI0021624FEB|nr:beta-ketoacyl synthase N-terminal-like domain-containing protein [Alkalilimnicola ehrlichii]
MAAKPGAEAGKPVYIVDGSRTPFLKINDRPGPFSAADLAVAAGRPLLSRQPFDAADLDQIIVGNTAVASTAIDLARSIALRLNCGHQVTGYTVQRGEGSGMQAVDTAARRIATGEADLILAGGTDAMSHAPLQFDEGILRFYSEWQQRPGIADRLRLAMGFDPRWFRLRDPLKATPAQSDLDLKLGDSAEALTETFAISRARIDAYAIQSHQRAGAAVQSSDRPEREPIYSPDGRMFAEDGCIRADASPADFKALPPLYAAEVGRLTAGNSAPRPMAQPGYCSPASRR